MISKVISTRNATSTLRYVFKKEPHSKKLVTTRNLAIASQNVDFDYNNKFNERYTESQFYAVRKLAKNPNKKTQAYHVIISFSNSDFPVNANNQKQAKQACMLVNGFLKQQFPKETQYTVGVQRDGDGEKLHAHVVINSVMTNGKVLNTQALRLVDKGKKLGFRKKLDNYLKENFPEITGRNFIPYQSDGLVNAVTPAPWLKKRNVGSWKDELQDKLVNIIANSNSLDDFKQNVANSKDITLKERHQKVNKKGYRPAFTYKYKNHSCRDYYVYKKTGKQRGLGKGFTPQGIVDLLRQLAINKLKQETKERDELKRKRLEYVQKAVESDLIKSKDNHRNYKEKLLTDDFRRQKQEINNKSLSKPVNKNFKDLNNDGIDDDKEGLTPINTELVDPTLALNNQRSKQSQHQKE